MFVVARHTHLHGNGAVACSFAANLTTGEVASYPGVRRERLVSTVCACAHFTLVIFRLTITLRDLVYSYVRTWLLTADAMAEGAS